MTELNLVDLIVNVKNYFLLYNPTNSAVTRICPAIAFSIFGAVKFGAMFNMVFRA